MTAPRYPIRAVAQLTGLSVDTLRAWERRYGAVEPARNARGRMYGDRHIARLKQLAALVERGHAIGTIATLSDAALSRMSVDSARDADIAPAADLEPLLLALRRYDLEAIESNLTRLALVLPPTDFVFGVTLPALHAVGLRWESGSIKAAQEHLVSAILRSVLGGILRALPRRAGAPRMLFATPAGERHELGLLSAAVLAAAAGVHAIYLGPDLPAADLAHAVATSKADVLVLAATAVSAADRTDLRKLAALPRRVQIWIGGPQADAVRAQLGARAIAVASLPALQKLVERLAA